MQDSDGNEPDDFLSQALAWSGLEGRLWRRQELAAILQHQLDAALTSDLGAVLSRRAETAEGVSAGEQQTIQTFRDLFHHPHPPLMLLRRTKRFAEALAACDDATVPREIAGILDTLSIVVAITRCRCRISSLGDHEMQRQIESSLAEPWLDEPTRILLRNGRDAIASGGADLLPAVEIPPGTSSGCGAPQGRLAEYRLLERLGEGSMGTVYKAVHSELERLVAIKIFRGSPRTEGWARSRFRREIQAVGRLDHPNIVRAHDARVIGDTHFLVMEYVDGLDLEELVGRTGPLRVADACELIRQAALGLQSAHEHGLVHRDIKPSNLMLNRQGQVKVLDLGLARLEPGGLAGETTTLGQVMGTPDYIAPEQTSDSHAVDIRADIYSLGCTLYRLLTGRAPFSGPRYSTLLAKLTAHCEDTPPRVRRFRRDVPRALQAVLDRMLAKSVQRRPATPAEVGDALYPFTDGSDLSRLLAAAEGQPAAPVGTMVPRFRVSGRLARFACWVATAAAILLLLTARGRWMRAKRQERENSAAVRVEHDGRPAPSPAPAVPSDWIVLSWTRLRLGKPNLWLFRSDGSQRINITNDPRYFDIHPRFSPDGRQIAFVRGESLAESNGIYVCNVDGSELRPVVTASGNSERFASPVWLSPSLICYTRDPQRNRMPDIEAWRVELNSAAPQKIFRFQEAVGKGGGLITDTSPDRQQLAIIANEAGAHATTNVYVTDLAGKVVHNVWVDKPDEWRDARALWSHDGSLIAWHHNFTRGLFGTHPCYGIGMARLTAEGTWNARLQPAADTFVTALAWSPNGTHLLCARVHDPQQAMPAVTLYLIDEQFRTVRTLFELENNPWQFGQRELGRLADWVLVPADATSGLGR